MIPGVQFQGAFRRHSARKKTLDRYADAAAEICDEESKASTKVAKILTQFRPKNSRLLDALKKYNNVKPRSLEWLLKLLDGLYRAKMQNDEQRRMSGATIQSLSDFMFKHLAGAPSRSQIQEASLGDFALRLSM